MMWRQLIVVVFLLPGLTGWAQARSLTEKPAEVARLIEELGSEDPAGREGAEEGLVGLGPAAVAEVRRAHDRAREPEVRHRLGEVLHRLSDWGQEVDGLQVRLSADREEVKVGEEIRFTTTLANRSGEAVNLYVGFSASGVAFANGESLQFADKAGASVPGRRWLMGFCGTGEGPLFVTIEPQREVSYTCVGRVERDEQLAQDRGRVKGVLVLGNRMIAVGLPAGAEVVRVHVAHGVTPEHAKQAREARHEPKPTDPEARAWTGVVTSNEVRVRIRW